MQLKWVIRISEWCKTNWNIVSYFTGWKPNEHIAHGNAMGMQAQVKLRPTGAKALKTGMACINRQIHGVLSELIEKTLLPFQGATLIR